MKNTVLSLLCLLFTTHAFPQQEKMIRVVTHNRITIVTNPSTGIKHYAGWGVFPEKEREIRKIVMHLTLGTPDSLPTAHWDYLDFIKIKRIGGRNGKSFDGEIARMLTPYGSIFTKGWQHTWSVDVTDFSLLLRDSVEVEYGHSGYEPNTVGWMLNICFEITPGKEVAKPLSIVPLWTGSFKYGDAADDIEKHLAPIPFTTSGEVGLARVRIQHTGHGMDETKGCSEFCSRWRELIFDGQTIDRCAIWKNCGNNPLYPQGGTWIYDRGAWCPGDLQQPWQYDLFTKPGEHTVDIRMEPYDAKVNPTANEVISSYLVLYSPSTSKSDVSLEAVIVPNSDRNYSRRNPAISKPVIVIRNLGSENPGNLEVVYGTKGFAKKTFLWKGNLPFNKTDTLALPGTIDFLPGENTFEVTVRPTGRKDGWPQDNSLSVQFNAPVIFPEKMVLQFLSNNKPEENSMTIKDDRGRIIFSKNPKDIKPKTMYFDTLALPGGNYCFELTDSLGDGLEFWYEPESGYGYMRLLTPDGKLIHNFESDCGDGQYLCFTTSPTFTPDTTKANYAFVMFPRRTKDLLNLDIHSDRTSPMEVVITADGVVVEKHVYQSVKSCRFVYDLSYLPPKRYILEVLVDGESRFKRRFNKE